MVKIEVAVKENQNDTCNITVKRPKSLKNATEGEQRTANVIKNAIDVALETLSKSK
jgi:hypothetical protein